MYADVRYKLKFFLPLLLLAVSLSILGSCGGGASTETNGNLGGGSGSGSSTDIAAATEDVQRFKLNFWDKAKQTDRCGQCHNANGQEPKFARSDNVNLAYADAIKYANFALLYFDIAIRCYLSS